MKLSQQLSFILLNIHIHPHSQSPLFSLRLTAILFLAIQYIVTLMSTRQDSRNYALESSNCNQISFSFDNHRNQEKEARKTIDQYLRLKTNESIEEKINLPAKRSSCYRKSLKSQEAEGDSEYHMQLKNDEQALRIESLTKQYELKLSKQEEFFALREWKLKEEVENLTCQVGSLNEEVRRLRAAGKQQNSHCSLCSDGQIIAHLNTVLKEAEENHRHCLDSKKQMTRRLDNSNGRLEVLEEEQEKIYQQCKILGKQVRTCNSQIQKLQEERNQIKETLVKKEAEWEGKRIALEGRIGELTKQIAQYQRKEEERSSSISNSKITLPSSQSALNNIQNNLNGSFLNPRSSYLKQRNSISKVVLQQDPANLQNYSYYRKMSDNAKSSAKFKQSKCSSKIDSMKWKFF